jgi:uncharacterized protein Yka (UPF0111/DUF47 family)
VEVDSVKRSWFLPESPDVVAMLCLQAVATIQGMDGLVAWAGGDAAAAEVVRDAEHLADDHKRALREALTVAFTTPVDAEDLYVMSERLDAVMNGAKDAVREAEVMAVGPDPAMAQMAALLAEGVRHVGEAFRGLAPERRRPAVEAPTAPADRAIRSQRELERVYRAAMSALLDVHDVRDLMGKRELYRRFSRASEDLTEAADRVWYATVKET